MPSLAVVNETWNPSSYLLALPRNHGHSSSKLVARIAGQIRRVHARANASYSLDSTGGLTGPFYQTVNAPVDAQHDYACWLWTTGYVYANNLAAAEIEVVVYSFNFRYALS